MISTVSLGVTLALCINDIYDVPYVHTNDAPSSNDILSGIFHKDCSGQVVYSHNTPLPPDGKPHTRSPTLNDLTLDPTSTTIPANSLPGTNGGLYVY